MGLMYVARVCMNGHCGYREGGGWGGGMEVSGLSLCNPFQFGIAGDPAKTKKWSTHIRDDPVGERLVGHPCPASCNDICVLMNVRMSVAISGDCTM